ncbi:hypothetical protein FQZ97_396410 [compost metagenome]
MAAVREQARSYRGLRSEHAKVPGSESVSFSVGFPEWRRSVFPTERPAHEHRNPGTDLRLQGGSPVRPDDPRLGHRRHGHGRVHRRPARLAGAEPRPALDQLRPPAPAAHQPGDLRLRRQRAVRHQLLHGAAHLPGAALWGRACRLHLLGLAGAGGDPAGHPAPGPDHHQGIRRGGIHRRGVDGHHLGRLRRGVLRHHHQAQDQAHLCGQLVLRRLHRGHRHAPRGRPPGHSGELVQVLLGLLRRHRCDGAVVVRPQRRGLFPHHRLPRDDVLLHPQAGRAPGVFLSPVHRALLGADHPVHLGRPAPPALHRPAGLGPVPRHGDVDHPAGAQLGRHDQRHDDPLRRLA